MKIDLTLKSGKVITLTPAELMELIDFKKIDDVVVPEKPAPVWGSGLEHIRIEETVKWDSLPNASGYVASDPDPVPVPEPTPKPKVDWLELLRRQSVVVRHTPVVSG